MWSGSSNGGGTNWFYTLGTATMVTFINQVITGIVLGMYYEPSATRASASPGRPRRSR
jgi:quinol-cytochrome oxidoreductase complex cytochrome b subunit